MPKHTTAADKATASDREELSVDHIHRLLSSSRRRAILDVVMDQRIVSKSALVDAVAAAENDTTPEAVSGQPRKRVHVSLHQCHLGKLEEAGVIVRENRDISIGPNASRVNQFRHDSRSGAISRIKSVLQ